MSLIVNREGNLSIFRIGLIVGGLGLIFIIGGVIALTFEQSQRRSPFMVELFPGAEEWSRQDYGTNRRRVIFQVPGGDAEVIAGHYQSLLDSHYNNDPNDPDRDRCIRTPESGTFPGYQAGDGTVPFLYRCEFDNSTFGASQSTTVKIEPGVRNNAEGFDNEGLTFIVYEHVWSN